MKGLFRSKLVLTLVALVLIASAIAIPLAGSITHSHAASSKTQPSLRDTPAWNYISSAGQMMILRKLGISSTVSSKPSDLHSAVQQAPVSSQAVVTGNVPVNAIKTDTTTTQSETTIAIDPTSPGVLMAGYNDDSLHSSNFTGYSFSLDGGTSWTDAGFLPPPSSGGSDGGDPALTVDKKGTFYFAQLASNSSGEFVSMSLCSFSSKAKAVTCALPLVVSAIGNGTTVFNDKEYITYDPVHNRVYVTWTVFSMAGATPEMRFFDVGTKKFSSIFTLSSVVQGSGTFPVATSTGLLYVFYEGFNNTGLKGPEAIDYVTFDPKTQKISPVKVVANQSILPATSNTSACGREAYTTQAFDTMHAARANEFPWVAVDSFDDIYVVWNSEISSGSPVSNIFFSILPHGSSHWTAPSKVKASSLIQFQPAVAIAHKTVAITYFQVIKLKNGSYRIERDQADAPVATSPIFKPFTISTQSFAADQTNPNFDPRIATCYMGDYSASVGSVKGPNVYSLWGDNRNVVPGIGPQPDVYATVVTVP